MVKMHIDKKKRKKRKNEKKIEVYSKECEY